MLNSGGSMANAKSITRNSSDETMNLNNASTACQTLIQAYSEEMKLQAKHALVQLCATRGKFTTRLNLLNGMATVTIQSATFL
uniref:Uncharacterized protein n=1 Tax=Arundo donax TaxID=35708 RepID=A0A0A9DGS9_ARUDO